MKGENGAGVEIFNIFEGMDFKNIGFKGGFSIGGMLDIGLKASYSFYKIVNKDANDLNAAIYFNAFILKQTQTMPLSIQILFSYGLTNVISDNLDLNNDTVIDRRFGHGFSLGAGLYRDFFLNKFNIAVGIVTEYTSYLFITQPITVEEDTVTDENRTNNLEYGGEIGFIITAFEGFYLSIRTRFTMDLYSNFKWQPMVGITKPFN